MFGKDSKYVVGQVMSTYGPHESVVIIPNHTTHADVRNAFVEGSIVSAGFFHITYVEGRLVARPYGESISLKVKSDPEKDRRLLERALRLDAVDLPR